MKRTILMSLLIAASLSSISMTNKDPLLSKEIKTGAFDHVIINANVTVMLVSEDIDAVRVEGDDMLMKEVQVSEKEGRLMIKASSNRNLKNHGVIYVPARLIQRLEVNSSAMVKSLTILTSPKLDVFINGNCNLVLITQGNVNLVGSPLFEVDYAVREIRGSSGIVTLKDE